MNLVLKNNMYSLALKRTVVPSTSCLRVCVKSTKTEDPGSSSSSSSSSSSDSDDNSKEAKPTNEQKLQRLNNLLQNLIQNDTVVKTMKLDLAKPRSGKPKKESAADEVSIKTETIEKKMVNAVKSVASDLGGDIKQTESELLMKLLNPETSPTSSRNLMDVMKGMKIDRETKTVEKSRAEQVRSILQTTQSKLSYEDKKPERRMKRPPQQIRQKRETVVEKIDLFGGECLNIFTNKSELKDTIQTKTWQRLYERDLKLAVTHPPSNYFQQMVLWTEQEKLWKFPIDNEQGLDEEKKVDFSRHVFLEEHLDPWCPSKGPLRHFMELVCVGLSKNPYLTVDAKIEHILWYRDYFESKKKLLKDVGALPAESEAPKAIQ